MILADILATSETVRDKTNMASFFYRKDDQVRAEKHFNEAVREIKAILDRVTDFTQASDFKKSKEELGEE